MNNKISTIAKEVGLILIIVVAMLLPRIFELNKFVATDESIWLMRSSNFYYALGQRDFEKTNQNGGPTGVVTMWIESIAFLIEYPEYRSFGQGYFSNFRVYESFLDDSNIDPVAILTTSRMLMIMLLTSVISVAFYLTKNMIGVYATLTGFILIAFDPLYLGLSRISHTDAPQATFQFASILAFIYFINFGKKPAMLILSGVLGGFGLLSKLPAIISGLVVAVISFLDFRTDLIINQIAGFKMRFSQLLNPIKIMLVWTAVVFSISIMFFPYAWSNSFKIVSNFIYAPIMISSRAIDSDSNYKDYGIYKKSDTTIWRISRYVEGFYIKSNPVVLLGLVVITYSYFRRLHITGDPNVRKVIQALFLFVLIYWAIMFVPRKWSTRYILSVFLALDLLAGIGLVSLGQEISSKFNSSQKRVISILLVITMLGIQVYSSVKTFPYYFSYINPLVLENYRTNDTHFIGVGEGLDIAADYLNNKPNAEELVVYSWYGLGPFSFFFDGVTKLIPKTSVWGSEEIDMLLNESDYVVIYVNQWVREIPTNLFDVLADVTPEHIIWINEIEYVRIYNTPSINLNVVGR